MANFVLTAQLALQAPANTKQVVSQLRRQLQGINVNINLQANTSQLNNVNAQLNQTSTSARTAEKSISELGRSLGTAARRFGVIAIATGTFLSLSRAIKSSLGDAIEFERQLVNLSQVTGKSVKNLQDITGEITRLSTGLGVSSDQLLKTSVVLAQAGLEARKVKSALEVLAKTELASSFDNIANTTEGAIAILSQFRTEAAAAGGDVAYLERALGAINDVSKKFAVESADLVAVIRRSGGAFEAAGGSLNELLALFTSVRATTRESAETIATGLRTIFTRIQRVDTIAQLQELGIALQDVEGKFVGPFEAIKRISEGLAELDPRDFRFSAIVEELGGYRQIGKVIPLIKQFTVAQDALNTAQAASGSLTKDAETAQLSLANKLSKVKEEFQALIREFVDSNTFRDVAGGALEFARALIRIADAVQPLIPLIGALAAIQIGKGLIPALGAFTGLNRRNAGGPIRKFATGGFVPGSGNRDTVPAMLTPGEFVIRKSSVNKIGAQRLQKLNSGGQVWDQKAFAALTLEDFQNKKTFEASNPFTKEVKKIAKSRNIKLKNSYPVDIFGIDQEKFSGSDLKNDFAKGAQIAINNIADKFKQAGIKTTTVPAIPDNVLNKFKNSIGQGTIGSLFEAAISAIKDPNFTDATDQQRPFDFIGGIGGAEKLFAGFNNATYKYADAKVSESAARGKSSTGFNSKINRQAKRELSGLQGKDSKQVGSENLRKSLDQYAKENSGMLSRNKMISFIQKEQKSTVTKTPAGVQKWFSDRGINGVFERSETSKSLNFIYKNLGGKIQKFAKGGAASDTVPAMLTPGEFVVNKKTAQSVGYANLHRMNKTGQVQGFANGGVVGFQTGGPVNPSLTPPAGKVAGLSKFETIFNKIAQDAGGFSTTLEVLQKTLIEYKNTYQKINPSLKAYAASQIKVAKLSQAHEKTLIDQLAAQEKLTQQTGALKERMGRFLGSAQNFVFLGSSISAVVAQFSSLDQVTADAITETLTMASTTIALVGTIGELILTTGAADFALKYFTAAVTNAANATAGKAATSVAPAATGIIAGLSKFLLNPITLVVAATVGVILGAIYYFEAKARKAAEALDKKAEGILQEAEQGKGGSVEAFTGARVAAVQAAQQAPSYSFTSQKAMDQEIIAAGQAAAALYNVSVAGRLLEEKLSEIQKNSSLTDLEKSSLSIQTVNDTFKSSAETFVTSAAALRKITDGKAIEDLSGRQRVTAEDFNKSIQTAQERMSDALVKNSQFLQQAVEQSIKNYDFSLSSGDPVGDILSRGLQKTLNDVNATIAQEAQARIKRLAEDAMASGSPEALELAQKEIAAITQRTSETIANNEQSIKAQIEAANKQAISSALITKALAEQRNDLIKANAAIKLFSQTIENVSKYNKSLESTISRLNSGISSVEISNVQGIGNLNEIIDVDAFKSELDKAVKPFGDFGDVISANLNSTATILEKARKTLLNVRFGEADIQGTINDLFSGVNINSDLRNAISSLIKDATEASTEGQSTITASEFENIFAPLLAQSEPYRKAVEGIINTQKELISSNISYLAEINKARQEEIDNVRKMVDVETRLQDRLAAATSKNLSIQQKEARRNLRRGFGASNRNDVLNRFTEVSDAMRDFQQKIEASTETVETTRLQKAQSALSVEFNNLKGVIEELADQSDRASDVMAEIDKERAKRDTTMKLVESFVIGGEQERADLNRQFEGLSVAMATGTLQGLSSEDRQATSGLLNQLADVDEGFAQLKKNLIVGDALRLGLDPRIAQALANQTPKEDKLINELIAISNEERIFQQALNQNTLKESQALSKKYELLSNEINAFPTKLKDALKQATIDAAAEQAKLQQQKDETETRRQQEASAAQDKREKEAQARSERIAQIQQDLTETTEFAGQKNSVLIGSIRDLTEALNRETTRLKTIENAVDQAMMDNKDIPTGLEMFGRGGTVYASRGKLINMQPKGTDTVPAMLTPGEFVMRKAAVDKYGPDFMQSVNQMSYAATGGHVSRNGVNYLQGGGGATEGMNINEELTNLVKERAKFLANALGVNESDILGKLSFDSDMAALGKAIRGKESASDLKLNPAKLSLNSLSQRQLATTVIDHELAHSIDNLFARRSGVKGSLSSIMGSENVFRSLSEGYFKDSRNFLHFLNTYSDSYITNQDDLRLIKTLKEYDRLNELNPRDFSAIFKRNPKLLAEGFPLAFQDLPDDRKANLLSAIQEEYTKTGKVPSYRDVAKNFTEKDIAQQYKVVNQQKLDAEAKNSIAKQTTPPETTTKVETKAQVAETKPNRATKAKQTAFPPLETPKPATPAEAPTQVETKAQATETNVKPSSVEPSKTPSKISPLQETLEKAGLKKGIFRNISPAQLRAIEGAINRKMGGVTDIQAIVQDLNANVTPIPDDPKFNPLAEESKNSTQRINKDVAEGRKKDIAAKKAAALKAAEAKKTFTIDREKLKFKPQARTPAPVPPRAPSAISKVLKAAGTVMKVGGTGATVITSAFETLNELSAEKSRRERLGKRESEMTSGEVATEVTQAAIRGISKGVDPTALLPAIDWAQSQLTGKTMGLESTTQVASEASREFQNVMDTKASYKDTFKPYNTSDLATSEIVGLGEDAKVVEGKPVGPAAMLEKLQKEIAMLTQMRDMQFSNALMDESALYNEKDYIRISGIKKNQNQARYIIERLNGIEGFQSSGYTSMVGSLSDYLNVSEQALQDKSVTYYASQAVGMTEKYDALKAKSIEYLEFFKSQYNNLTTTRLKQLEDQLKKEQEIYKLNYNLDPDTGKTITQERIDAGVKPITYQEYSLKRQEKEEQQAAADKLASQAQMDKTAALLGKSPEAYKNEVEQHVELQKITKEATNTAYTAYQKQKDMFMSKYAGQRDVAIQEFEKIHGSGRWNFYPDDVKDNQTLKDNINYWIKYNSDPVQNSQQKIDSLNEGTFSAEYRANGGIIYRASGGSIFKPKGTDTIPAMLTPGEFVMQKSAVDKYGIDTMQAMNQGALYASKGKHVKYFKTGGFSDDPDVKAKLKEIESVFENTQGATPTQDVKSPMPKISDKVQKEIQSSLQNQLIEDIGQSSPVSLDTDSLSLNRAIPSSTTALDLNTVQKIAASDDVRNPDYQKRKRAELVAKRRAEEKRKRQIRSGEINPMKDRQQAIQDKLQGRRFNVATSRYERQQESLPSYLRDKMPPEHLQSPENFKAYETEQQSIYAKQKEQFEKNMAARQRQIGFNPQQNMMMGQNPMMAFRAGQQGGAGDQAFNIEPLVKLQQTFENLAMVLGNMQMTHQVNVDGALNINGVNTVEVATAIQQAIGKFITAEVERIVNNKGFRTAQ